MPLSVAAISSFQPISFAPGVIDTFGMRWKATLLHESAYEQP